MNRFFRRHLNASLGILALLTAVWVLIGLLGSGGALAPNTFVHWVWTHTFDLSLKMDASSLVPDIYRHWLTNWMVHNMPSPHADVTSSRFWELWEWWAILVILQLAIVQLVIRPLAWLLGTMTGTTAAPAAPAAPVAPIARQWWHTPVTLISVAGTGVIVIVAGLLILNIGGARTQNTINDMIASQDNVSQFDETANDPEGCRNIGQAEVMSFDMVAPCAAIYRTSAVSGKQKNNLGTSLAATCAAYATYPENGQPSWLSEQDRKANRPASDYYAKAAYLANYGIECPVVPGVTVTASAPQVAEVQPSTHAGQVRHGYSFFRKLLLLLLALTLLGLFGLKKLFPPKNAVGVAYPYMTLHSFIAWRWGWVAFAANLLLIALVLKS